MNEELQDVKKEIAAKNELLLAARRKLKADPNNTDAQADVEHYDKELARLETRYNTLVTALANVPAPNHGILLMERLILESAAVGTLGTAPLGLSLVGRVMKVCINQNKLVKKYLTPAGSAPSTPPEASENSVAAPLDLSKITLKLDNPMFYNNSSYRYCIVVDYQIRKVELLPPTVTVVLITAFGDKPLAEVLAPEEFKRVIPISPTHPLPGTANPIHTSPEWMPHPKHKTPCYVLCLPIQVIPMNLEECDEDDQIVVDPENLNYLKLHLLSLGGIVANADFVDSDEDEDAEGNEVCSMYMGKTVRWDELVV